MECSITCLCAIRQIEIKKEESLASIGNLLVDKIIEWLTR